MISPMAHAWLAVSLPPYGTHTTLYIVLHAHTINDRACLMCDDTQRYDRGGNEEETG